MSDQRVLADDVISSFACLNYAFAKVAATTELLPSVHYFEFNRSYQIPTYPSEPQNFVSVKYAWRHLTYQPY